jgi:Protein of unknown function (DUF3689)
LADDEIGFISKILRSLRRSKKHDNVLFWAYNFLECYVRGLNPYIQIFYTASGLLKELVDIVLSFKPDTMPMIIQITLDLMGELVKFNMFNMTAIDRLLAPENRAQDFYSVIDRNLVDSNVFIRSLLQSEYYRVNMGNEHIKRKNSPPRNIHKRGGPRLLRGTNSGQRGCLSSSALPDRLKHYLGGSKSEFTPQKEKTSQRGFSSTVGSRSSKNQRMALLAKLGYKINSGTNTWTAKSEIDDLKLSGEMIPGDDDTASPAEPHEDFEVEISHQTYKLSSSPKSQQADPYQKIIDYPLDRPQLVSMLANDLRNVLWRLMSSVTPKSLRYDSKYFYLPRYLLHQYILHYSYSPPSL